MSFAWTKTAPTQVGWYWVRFSPMSGYSPIETIVPVASRTSWDGYTVFRCTYNSGDCPVSEVVGEWAGPIPMPTEAA